MRFEFIKYQGCGNDFIIRDETDHEPIPEDKRGTVAKSLCHRNFGVGADGLIFVTAPSEKGVDARMRLFDRDGPEADMCGNGVRCLAAYLHKKLDKKCLLIETSDGIKEVHQFDDQYRVHMGKLRYKADELRKYFTTSVDADNPLLDIVMRFPEVGQVRISVVNSGEPHAVVFVEDIDSYDIRPYGKNITENHAVFPRLINFDFAEVVSNHIIKIRTYERGVFRETLACGTGATAVAGVAWLTQRVDQGRNEIDVMTRGGKIKISMHDDREMYMTGPATLVYGGAVELHPEKLSEIG